MKVYRLKTWIVSLFIIICLGFVLYSAYNILIWKHGVDTNKKIKDKLNKHVIKSDDEYIVDFDELKKLNTDAIAYLHVNNTNIDYVVVKGNNNDYYLNHNFNKEYSEIGWIFMDYRNKLDATDKNIIIYGHNTRDGSMFGSLRNVLKRDWQDNSNNRIITLITEKGEIKYQVFSTYSIEKEDYYITTGFNSDKEFLSFADKLRYRSNYNYKTNVGKDDKILTLSTCTANGKKRVVLHAKQIN